MLYVVCDGVSTTDDGGWAARVACERLTQSFAVDGLDSIDDLKQIVSEIDWELRGQGRGKAACTLALLWLRPDSAHSITVGDSRVYRIRDQQVEMIDGPDLGGSAMLTVFLGMGPQVSEAMVTLDHESRKGDAYLLVTDGVVDVIEEQDLAQWWKLTGGRPERCADAIVREVARVNGDDDATVVVVRID